MTDRKPSAEHGGRFFDCPHYDHCLDIAALNDWASFSCSRCKLNKATFPAPIRGGAVVVVEFFGELVDVHRKIQENAASAGRPVQLEILVMLISNLVSKGYICGKRRGSHELS